ncbi:MAG: transposase [Mollicutes bacterium]|nr:transposase [Mollicutes bacterium]
MRNTFLNNYNNSYIKGNNNFIKVFKKSAFGYRSFLWFKTQIMICKGMISPKIKEA